MPIPNVNNHSNYPQLNQVSHGHPLKGTKLIDGHSIQYLSSKDKTVIKVVNAQNASPEKVERIARDSRAVLTEWGHDGQFQVAVNEKWSHLINNELVKEFTVLDSSGSASKISDFTIRTQTNEEAQYLNRALSQLILAIHQYRQTENNASPEGTKQPLAANSPTSKSEHPPLKPSKFLAAAQKNIVLNMFIESSRSQERKKSEDATKKDDEVSEIKRDVIKHSNLKSDRLAEDIKQDTPTL